MTNEEVIKILTLYQYGDETLDILPHYFDLNDETIEFIITNLNKQHEVNKMTEFDKLRVFFNLIGIKTNFIITMGKNRQIIVYYDKKDIYDVVEIVKDDKAILELYAPTMEDVYQSYLAKDIVRYLLEHVK